VELFQIRKNINKKSAHVLRQQAMKPVTLPFWIMPLTNSNNIQGLNWQSGLVRE
jgi:hypothetical protein